MLQITLLKVIYLNKAYMNTFQIQKIIFFQFSYLQLHHMIAI
jgi:hypothetical protein